MRLILLLGSGLIILAATGCRKKSVVPEPYSKIAGRWELVSVQQVDEVTTDEGRDFTPVPPQEFTTEFLSDAAILHFEGFNCYRGLSQVSLNIHPDQSETIVGNNGLYYCSFDSSKDPPQMRLDVLPNGWKSEKWIVLATYELSEAAEN